MTLDLGEDGPPRVAQDRADRDSSIRRIVRASGGLAALPLIALVRFYQVVISPLTPPTCRYYPSCSSYAVTALRRFGPVKGTWLAVRRVLRCHPWSPGGVDHVPSRPHRPIDASPTAPVDAPLDAGADTASLTSSHSRSPERPTPRDKGLS